MFEDKEKINRALVSVVIEKALLNLGKPAYKKIIEILDKEYHCGLTDCYGHPEYLHAILKKFFGNASNVVIESIKKDLEEHKEIGHVTRFLDVLSQ